MSAGRNNQLTRQIGEHLVAAKLGRLGYVATPFAGNVPLIDILAADTRGYAIPIQVKAIYGPSWQFRADAFLDIELTESAQTIRGPRKLINPDLLCILVLLGNDEGAESYFVMRLSDLQEHFFRTYTGVRPKNPHSLHCAIWPADVEKYRDNWDLLRGQFPPEA